MPGEPKFRAARRRGLRGISDELARRRRRPPRIRRARQPGTRPTVYYLCPDYRVPSGGVRMIYRHVDMLNSIGIDAAVLHHRDGFSARWFEHRTRIVSARSARLSAADTLVVPEIYGPYLDRLPPEPRLIAFNQNAYLTFDRVAPGGTVSYDPFEAAITVSPDSAEFLRFGFPNLDVTVVSNGVDSEVFFPPMETPGKRIALMPRKRPGDVDQVIRLLGERLRGWEVVAIDGVGEAETAALLRGAPIFLALGRREGFGMPAAEAMASGCYTIGYPGFGGRELFDPRFSVAVADGDVLGLAREAATAIDLFEREPEVVAERGFEAAKQVLERYSLERQQNELAAFYEHFERRSRRSKGVPSGRGPRRWTELTIRAFDLVGAIALLLMLAPLMLLVAIAVGLDSAGSPIYRQRRVGRDLEEFSVAKFRTMRTDADPGPHRAHVARLIEGDGRAEAPMAKLATDPRVTRIGRLLRRTSLDELPQLWNVLKGEMSLVGPRPPIRYEVERYPARAFRRFAVRPGITGLWQVSGRSLLSFRQMIELDVEYVERRSLGFNLKILLRTLPTVFAGKGAA